MHRGECRSASPYLRCNDGPITKSTWQNVINFDDLSVLFDFFYFIILLLLKKKCFSLFSITSAQSDPV